MCKRSTTDPLVRMFLDRYHLNLLPVPREQVDCGQLFVKRGRAVSMPGDARQLFEPSVTLPPPFRAEVMADIAGTLSENVSADVGLSLLQSFLAALGLAGIVDKLAAHYQRRRATSVRFRFADASRDSMDPLSLGTAFLNRAFVRRHPLVAPENRYYIIAAVVRSPSISVMVQDDRSAAVDLEVGVLAALEAEPRLTTDRSVTGEITYRGTKHLAIGVELYELRYDEAGQRLEMLPPEAAVDLRRGRPVPPPAPAFLGDGDSVFLNVAD